MSPSLSPVVSHRSSPSPPVILSPAPGDAVDLGAMSAAVEGARASGGETRRRNDRSREEHFDQKQTEEVQARKVCARVCVCMDLRDMIVHVCACMCACMCMYNMCLCHFHRTLSGIEDFDSKLMIVTVTSMCVSGRS